MASRTADRDTTREQSVDAATHDPLAGNTLTTSFSSRSDLQFAAAESDRYQGDTYEMAVPGLRTFSRQHRQRTAAEFSKAMDIEAFTTEQHELEHWYGREGNASWQQNSDLIDHGKMGFAKRFDLTADAMHAVNNHEATPDQLRHLASLKGEEREDIINLANQYGFGDSMEDIIQRGADAVALDEAHQALAVGFDLPPELKGPYMRAHLEENIKQDPIFGRLTEEEQRRIVDVMLSGASEEQKRAVVDAALRNLKVRDDAAAEAERNRPGVTQYDIIELLRTIRNGDKQVGSKILVGILMKTLFKDGVGPLDQKQVENLSEALRHILVHGDDTRWQHVVNKLAQTVFKDNPEAVRRLNSIADRAFKIYELHKSGKSFKEIIKKIEVREFFRIFEDITKGYEAIFGQPRPDWPQNPYKDYPEGATPQGAMDRLHGFIDSAEHNLGDPSVRLSWEEAAPHLKTIMELNPDELPFQVRDTVSRERLRAVLAADPSVSGVAATRERFRNLATERRDPESARRELDRLERYGDRALTEEQLAQAIEEINLARKEALANAPLVHSEDGKIAAEREAVQRILARYSKEEREQVIAEFKRSGERDFELKFVLHDAEKAADSFIEKMSKGDTWLDAVEQWGMYRQEEKDVLNKILVEKTGMTAEQHFALYAEALIRGDSTFSWLRDNYLFSGVFSGWQHNSEADRTEQIQALFELLTEKEASSVVQHIERNTGQNFEVFCRKQLNHFATNWFKGKGAAGTVLDRLKPEEIARNAARRRSASTSSLPPEAQQKTDTIIEIVSDATIDRWYARADKTVPAYLTTGKWEEALVNWKELSPEERRAANIQIKRATGKTFEDHLAQVLPLYLGEGYRPEWIKAETKPDGSVSYYTEHEPPTGSPAGTPMVRVDIEINPEKLQLLLKSLPADSRLRLEQSFKELVTRDSALKDSSLADAITESYSGDAHKELREGLLTLHSVDLALSARAEQIAALFSTDGKALPDALTQAKLPEIFKELNGLSPVDRAVVEELIRMNTGMSLEKHVAQVTRFYFGHTRPDGIRHDQRTNTYSFGTGAEEVTFSADAIHPKAFLEILEAMNPAQRHRLGRAFRQYASDNMSAILERAGAKDHPDPLAVLIAKGFPVEMIDTENLEKDYWEIDWAADLIGSEYEIHKVNPVRGESIFRDMFDLLVEVPRAGEQFYSTGEIDPTQRRFSSSASVREREELLLSLTDRNELDRSYRRAPFQNSLDAVLDKLELCNTLPEGPGRQHAFEELEAILKSKTLDEIVEIRRELQERLRNPETRNALQDRFNLSFRDISGLANQIFIDSTEMQGRFLSLLDGNGRSALDQAGQPIFGNPGLDETLQNRRLDRDPAQIDELAAESAETILNTRNRFQQTEGKDILAGVRSDIDRQRSPVQTELRLLEKEEQGLLAQKEELEQEFEPLAREEQVLHFRKDEIQNALEEIRKKKEDLASLTVDERGELLEEEKREQDRLERIERDIEKIAEARASLEERVAALQTSIEENAQEQEVKENALRELDQVERDRLAILLKPEAKQLAEGLGSVPDFGTPDSSGRRAAATRMLMSMIETHGDNIDAIFASAEKYFGIPNVEAYLAQKLGPQASESLLTLQAHGIRPDTAKRFVEALQAEPFSYDTLMSIIREIEPGKRFLLRQALERAYLGGANLDDVLEAKITDTRKLDLITLSLDGKDVGQAVTDMRAWLQRNAAGGVQWAQLEQFLQKTLHTDDDGNLMITDERDYEVEEKFHALYLYYVRDAYAKEYGDDLFDEIALRTNGKRAEIADHLFGVETVDFAESLYYGLKALRGNEDATIAQIALRMRGLSVSERVSAVDAIDATFGYRELENLIRENIKDDAKRAQILEYLRGETNELPTASLPRGGGSDPYAVPSGIGAVV